MMIKVSLQERLSLDFCNPFVRPGRCTNINIQKDETSPRSTSKFGIEEWAMWKDWERLVMREWDRRQL